MTQVDNSDHDASFLDFHAAHPEVYTSLVRLARQAKSRGRVKGGVGMFWEVLRWEQYLRTEDDASNFKLNNNYRSRYARLIEYREKDLEGFFETRNLRS